MQQIDALTGTKTAGKPTTTTGIWAPAPKQEAKPTSMLGANSLLAKLYEGPANNENDENKPKWNFKPLTAAEKNIEAETIKSELCAQIAQRDKTIE